MTLKIIKGNIFTTQCKVLVNTVNCVGIMGAGIALECKLRYPEMYEKYVTLCGNKMMNIGNLWLYKAADRWILNFPTKLHWKDPTREKYLHDGLRKFVSSYKEKGIDSVAFPLLGAQHGGLSPAKSQQIMESYLEQCSIPVEIYLYDPGAPDDLYISVRDILLKMSPDEIRQETGLRSNYVNKVLEALKNPAICQLNRLATIDGIGTTTLEKVFAFARAQIMSGDRPVQQSLVF